MMALYNPTHPITIPWNVETVTEKPLAKRLAILQGSTVVLSPRLLHAGKPVFLPDDAEATLYWRPTGKGDFWKDKARIKNRSTLLATFGPDKDNGARSYEFFIAAKTADGINYNAFGNIAMLPSPGAVPSEIPFPPKSIDFDGLEVLNPDAAPWLEKSRIAAIAEQYPQGQGWTLNQLNKIVAAMLAAAQPQE